MLTDEEIRQSAKTNGWTALENLLPAMESTGAVEDEIAFLEEMSADIGSQLDLSGYTAKSAWNWAAQGYISPARDQGRIQACVAYSLSGLADFLLRRDGRSNFQTAEHCLHFCIFENEYTSGINTGGAIKYLSQKGVPIDVDNDELILKKELCPNLSAAQIINAKEFFIVESESDTKKIISNISPVVTYMDLCSDFSRGYKGGVYRTQHAPDSGEHAVLLIGYDDSQKYWIGKNSQGPAWGENGLFRIAYGQCRLVTGEQAVFGFSI